MASSDGFTTMEGEFFWFQASSEGAGIDVKRKCLASWYAMWMLDMLTDERRFQTSFKWRTETGQLTYLALEALAKRADEKFRVAGITDL